MYARTCTNVVDIFKKQIYIRYFQDIYQSDISTILFLSIYVYTLWNRIAYARDE